MARVTAYEASDGSLHRDKKAYLRHEANLMVAKELRALLDPDVQESKRPARMDDFQFAELLDTAYKAIVDIVGLNVLRDLFALQFKPGADDGDDAPATGAATAAGQATVAGQAAAEPATAGADI